MRRPLLALAAAFGVGCLLTDAEGPTAEALLLLLLGGSLVGLALRASAPWAALALGASAVALGSASALVAALHFHRGELRRGVLEGDGRPMGLGGVVRGDAALQHGRLRFTLAVERVRTRDRTVSVRDLTRIEVGGDSPLPRLTDGERVSVWAVLRALDWTDGRRDGSVARGYCKSARLLRREGEEQGPRRAIARLRALLRARLQKALPPGPERGLVLAMVLGDRSEIDQETDERFRASGTYHVLALSGAQVALVAGLIVGALRLLAVTPATEAVVTSGIVWFYAALVGGDVPIVRAALMTSAVLAGRAFDLAGEAANLLGFAAFLLLLWRPAHVWDVGFELSFGATLGILALVPSLSRGLARLPFRAEVALAASLAAQVVLAPILAARFHRLAPAALVLNLVAVPLSAAVLLLGLATLLLCPPLRPVAELTWAAAFALRRAGDLGPLTPWLDVRVAAPTFVVVAVHVAGLVQLGRGHRGKGLALLLVSHAGLLLAPSCVGGDGRLHVDVLDVGQGDSILLRSPSGRSLLIDAGGSHDPHYDVGERRVAPVLWDLGVRRIDALALTHGHPDHVGGAPFVLHAFDVDEVWEGPAAPRDTAWLGLDRSLREARVRRRCLRRGHRVSWDAVVLDVLGPRPQRPAWRARNEDSLVLAASLGEVTFLLAGDVQEAAEDALEVPRSIVLKVPHHGSRSSSHSRLVERAAPRVAIVSVGARNPFGHPSPAVLARYAAAGCLLLRTDRDGQVSVATDGSSVWVRTSTEANERRIR